MALSEQERRLLEQLEASLKEEDPQLAKTLSVGSQLQIHRRRATVSGLGCLLGVVALLSGIQIHPAVSIAGFAIMVIAAISGIGAWKRVQDSGEPVDTSSSNGNDNGTDSASAKDAPHSSKEFMDKLEERWRRRQEGEH